MMPHSLTMMTTINTEFTLFKFGLQIKIVNQFLVDTKYWVGIIKMRYSKKPKYKKYVKEYGVLLFARKFGDRCYKKLTDTAIKTGIDAAKTASKRVDQKNAEATADLIEKKIADKTTSVGKSKRKEKAKKAEEIHILPEKRQQIIDDLQLFWA